MILSFSRGDKEIAWIKGGRWNNKKVRIFETKEEDKKEDTSSEEEYEEVVVARRKEPPRIERKQEYEEPTEYNLFDDYNPDIVYQNPEDVIGLVNDDFYRKQKKYMMPSDIEQIKQYILTNETPKQELERRIVRKAKKQIKQAAETELYVPDGYVVPIMDEKTSRYFIAGPTGSGKSTIAADLIRQYKKQFPFNKVYLFSRVGSDPVLDGLKGVKRIPLDDNFIDYPPDSTAEYKNSLCVFDDIDTLRPKKLKDAVLAVREDILQVNRKFGTTLICTEHQLMNYKQTRNLLTDCEFVTFFPKSGSVYHINRFLKTYAGLNKAQIQKVLSLNSRAVTIHKCYPMYILSEHNVYLLG